MSKYQKISATLISLAIVLAPALVWLYSRPSTSKIKREKTVQVGKVKAANGVNIDIHIMIGDVFAPRKTHGDLGFDIATISCYFDPVQLEDGRSVLPGNPLLYSAMRHSFAKDDTTAKRYFLLNLLEALNKSREITKRFQVGGVELAMQGDQITPHIWPVHPETGETRITGVKYMAALPLFDPRGSIQRKYPPDIIRDRLAGNVKVAVHRLLDYSATELRNTAKTIGFAALGSTSHEAGDSPYFLEFDRGFLSIIKGIKDSSPSTLIDEVYLVAYDEHEGKYEEEAISSLQSVSNYFIINNIFSGHYSFSVGGILSFLFFLLGLTTYQQVRHGLKEWNRWSLIGRILTITPTLGACTWGLTVSISELVSPFNSMRVLFIHAGVSFVFISIIFWLSKRGFSPQEIWRKLTPDPKPEPQRRLEERHSRES